MTNTYPSPIISTQPGSWAHSTVKERLPEIAQRVIEENQFSPQINEHLKRSKGGDTWQTYSAFVGPGCSGL